MIWNPVLAANAAWTAKAIEECRHSAKVKEAGLCYICMKIPPCDHFETKDDARAAIDLDEGGR